MSARNFCPIPIENFGASYDGHAQIPSVLAGHAERRTEPRFACDYAARIIHPERRLALPARIVNISTSGASVEARLPSPTPSSLFLFDVDRDEAYECDVRWSAGNRIGVRFVDLLGRVRRRKLLEGEKLTFSTPPHEVHVLAAPPSGGLTAGPPPERIGDGRPKKDTPKLL